MNEHNLKKSQSDLDRNIVKALGHLIQVFRNLLWKYAAEQNMSPLQAQILIYTATHPKQENTVSEISRKYQLTAATVSDALKTLEQKRLLNRTLYVEDRRFYFFSLTETGKAVTEKLIGWHGAIIQQLENFTIPVKQNVLFFLLELVESLKRDHLLDEVKTCLSCVFFRRNLYHDPIRPHLCLKREVELADCDLRIDCPNYQ